MSERLPFLHELAGDIRHQFAPSAQCEGMVPGRIEAKISRGYLSQLEKGAYFVSIKIIGRLADKLDVEPAEFLKRPAKRGR
ncbi:helix-turn-helix domain-containing protein [Bradyrhizobium genosp. P]|uniref:helix-turn-helix domain-containing protein n=1 Tax=Bradyrhizobium genosp. P TaxID=83641 RepID=UPI003CF3DCB4